MENANELTPLLTEIRDIVKEQTELYREMATRSVEFQERAMRQSEAHMKQARYMMIFVVVAAGGLLCMIFLPPFVRML